MPRRPIGRRLFNTGTRFSLVGGKIEVFALTGLIAGRSSLNFNVRQRLGAAGKDESLGDFPVKDSAVVVHVDLSGDLHDLAGAAETELARSRNPDTGRSRRPQHGLAGQAFGIDIGTRETDRNLRFRSGLVGDVRCTRQCLRRRRAEAFLMVVCVMSKPAASSIPRTARMKGSGPQQKTSRPRKSGASSGRRTASMRPIWPNQLSREADRSSIMKPSDRPGMLAPRSSSSLRKMILGRLAQFTNATSVQGAQSLSQRNIDIIGVTPDPAEINRYCDAGWLWWVKAPIGPIAPIRSPGLRWSNIHRVPIDPGWALAVTDIVSGRDGLDDRV